MKRTPAITQVHQKRTTFHKKDRSLLAHIVELSTAEVKVDIKVTNASLTQNQCLQRVTLPLTYVEHVEIPRPRDGTELNNDGMIKLGVIPNRTEFINFSERD